MGSDVEEEQVSSMVPPLAYLCKTVLMTNHAALTAEKLEIVPSDIAQELFRDLRKTRSISSSKDLANFRNSLTKVCLAEVGHLPGPFMPELSTWEHLEYVHCFILQSMCSAAILANFFRFGLVGRKLFFCFFCSSPAKTMATPNLEYASFHSKKRFVDDV
jgi:hypothetical protein